MTIHSLRDIFENAPAAVPTSIIVIEISLIAHLDEVERDSFFLDCWGLERLNQRLRFKVRSSQVVFPQVNSPVDAGPFKAGPSRDELQRI